MSKSKKTREKQTKQRKKKMEQTAANSALPAIIIPGNNAGAGYIEHIWAEHGVVKTRRNDGVVKSMTWQDAAHRAGQLNAAVPGLPHVATKRSYLNLVERILTAVKEARHQLELGNKKTKGLHNLIDGRNEDGTAPKLGKIEDYLIDDYRKQYPTLGEDDIAIIMRSDVKWPTLKEKEMVMRTIHNERLRLKQGEAATGIDTDLVSEAAR